MYFGHNCVFNLSVSNYVLAASQVEAKISGSKNKQTRATMEHDIRYL